MKRWISTVAFVAAYLIAPTAVLPAFAQGSAQRDPNEKICQVIKPIGSRLGGKKICATRAEWEEQKRLDREATEKAQTQLCVIDPLTGRC
jgi:hypothetical protein